MLDQFETTPAPVDSRPPKRRTLRRLLAVLGVLVLLVVVALVGYAAFLQHTVSSNVKHEAMLPTAQPSITMTGSDGTTTTVPATDKGTNILFIGSDARPGDVVSRSDVIIVMHISQDHRHIYLVHFPRDLYVSIPGHGKNKINASYAYGKAPLLVTTLQNMLGIKIDHVAKTDFVGFKNMTNAVGGVKVWAEEPSNEYGYRVVKGWNYFNGDQALAFVRERHQLSQGDISRGERQQAFLKALMWKCMSGSVFSNPITVAKLTDAATKNLVVDDAFTVSKMRDLAFSIRNVRSQDIQFITAPFTGFGVAPNAGDIDIVDQAKMAKLGQAIRTDTLASWQGLNTVPVTQ